MATTALPSAANTSSLLVFKGAIGYTKANERAALLAGITKSQMVEYRSWFRRLDTMNHGYVEIEELEHRLSNENLVRASNEIGLIAAEMDTDGNGILDFEEFAIMMCFLEKLAKEHSKNNIFSINEAVPSLYSYSLWSQQFWQVLRTAVWETVDDPNSSLFASVLSVIIIAFIVLSTVALVVETMPSVQADGGFAVIEALTAVVFTLEFLARLLSTPRLGGFLHAPMNWIDFMSILPWYFDMVFDSNEAQVLRVFRVVRVVRIFKLSRYFTSLGLLTRAFINSGSAMGMAFFLTMLGVLLLGSIMFYIERGALNHETNQLEIRHGQPSRFYSIMQSCWWCIVTIASVGYGDVTPVTELGQMFGGLVSVFGVILLAFPVSIFSANFAEVYSSSKRKEALHFELQKNFVPVVQGRTGTSLLQSLLIHLPRVSLAQRQAQHSRSRRKLGVHSMHPGSSIYHAQAVALDLGPISNSGRTQAATQAEHDSASIELLTPSRRRSVPSTRPTICSTPTRTSFFTPPPTSPVYSKSAKHAQQVLRARSMSTGLLLANSASVGTLHDSRRQINAPKVDGHGCARTPTHRLESSALEGYASSDTSDQEFACTLPYSKVRRTRSWDENRNPSNHYANSSTSTHTVNLLANSQGGAMACVPVPLHNTNRGTGRNRLRTLRRSMSDSDIDAPVQPFGGVLGDVKDINPFGKGAPRAAATHVESDEMVLTADSFLGLDLADATVLKSVVAALLRDSRKRLWQRIRRVELRLRDELVTELSRRWRVWFGVHAAAVVVAATPYTIDRVKMAFQVRHCRVIPEVIQAPNSSDAYQPQVRFPASVKSVTEKAREHASLVTPERFTSFRSPARSAGNAAGVVAQPADWRIDQAIPHQVSNYVEVVYGTDTKCVPTAVTANVHHTSVHRDGIELNSSAIAQSAGNSKLPADRSQSEKDDDPVNWQKDLVADAASSSPLSASPDQKDSSRLAASSQLERPDSSGSQTTNTDEDSDGSHEVVYTKKVRTVKRSTSTGEQVTETETRIVKKKVRRAKRSDF